MRPLGSGFSRAAVAAGCAVAAWVSLPAVVLAHALLVQSTPADGARLATSPPSIQLTFSEGVAPGRVITISPYGRSGNAPVSLPAPLRSATDDGVTAALPALADGVYVVSWQVVSSADGHGSAGSFSFAVGDGGASLPTSTSSTPLPWLEVVLQAVLLVSLAVIVGALAVGRRRELRHPRSDVLIAACVVSQVAALALLAVLLMRLRPTSLTVSDLWHALVSTSAGLAEVLTVFLVLGGSLALGLRRERIALVLVLGAAGSVALRAHPSAATNVFVDIAVIVHIGVALLWAGGLFRLALVTIRARGGRTDPSQLSALMARYLRVAAATVVVVILTGAVLAAVELRSIGALFTTRYGQVLLVKTGLVAAAIATALIARRRLSTARPGAMALPVRREATALAGVLAVAALLSAVAPPSPTRVTAANGVADAAVPTSPTHVHEAAFAGDLAVYLTANPNSVVLYVRNFDYQPESAATVSATQSSGGASPGLKLRSCGPGCATAVTTWTSGVNTLRVTVRSPNWTGGTAVFSVAWPAQPAAIGQLLAVLTAMRTQSEISVTEQVSSGTHRSTRSTFTIAGATFVQTEPYGATTTDLHAVTTPSGQRSLLVFLSGSLIWGRLNLDSQSRLASEELIDQGHLIERTFTYPPG